MSDAEKKGPDRRALIAMTAAVLPQLPCPAAAQEGGGTRFVVDLGGVSLPDAIANRLQTEIRRAVLMAVAEAAPHTKFRNGTLAPGVRGIVLVPLRGGARHD
ncbi:MAG TPA: hypothetical protein VNU97_03605 [Rhizomicrobium sp.]|jgi:hypothetical protein|nr:hypothetical protein [Rhizomicrobium sp.]